MQLQSNYTGIDISKSFFDVAFMAEGKYSFHKFSNDNAGFKLLMKVLPVNSHVIMEASGHIIYSSHVTLPVMLLQ